MYYYLMIGCGYLLISVITGFKELVTALNVKLVGDDEEKPPLSVNVVWFIFKVLITVVIMIVVCLVWPFSIVYDIYGRLLHKNERES